jgi:hypothetical protein
VIARLPGEFRIVGGGQVANLPHGGDRKSDQAANLPLAPIKQVDAAKMLNVSERSPKRGLRWRAQFAPEPTRSFFGFHRID